MAKCFSCGGPLRTVREGLYRCLYCGQLNEERDGQVLPRRMEVFPRIEQVREAVREGVHEMAASAPSEGGLHTDMIMFMNRVVEKLIPIEGYNSDIKVKLLKTRSDIKKDLVNVFEGKMKFEDWYHKMKTNLGKGSTELDEIIYSSLEGLRHPEAIELRNAFEQKLQKGLLG
jgi:hypothetical protein